MDKEKYKELLDSVCEWRVEPIEFYPRPNGRTPKEDLDEQEEDTEDVLEQSDDIARQHKAEAFKRPIEFLRYSNSQVCDDCGRISDKTIVKEAKIYKTPKAHWRMRCKTCKLHKHPKTGKYSLTISESYRVWAEATMDPDSTDQR
jgi:hypothetical protein